jgi:hypothetical protein
MELQDFIKIYNGALPPKVCHDLIDNFEKHEDSHVLSGVGGPKEREDGYRSAIELNCSVVSDTDSDMKFLLSSLNKVVMDYANLYRYEMKSKGFSDTIPESNILEEWRMHRYDEGEHFYKKHVDSVDSNSSNRMLAFLFYPNTVEEGGETVFTDHLKGVECTAVQGRLLIFPTWMGFPHEAKSVIKGTKYMLKTYLHYPGELDID